MAAAAIHKLSARRRGMYVQSTAAVFTETLAESKLFGNRKGYPNPGTPEHKGIFETADGGTLFQDEIGECPEAMQPSLLRVLASGGFTRQGESIERHTDVRVVAATNRDVTKVLRSEIVFRFVKRVRVPELSERREDIPLLVRHLVIQRAEKEEGIRRFLFTGPTGRTELNISGRAVDYLVRHPLTGNVRELEILLDELIDGSKGNQVRLPSADEAEGAGADSAGEDSLQPKRPSEEAVRVALRNADGNVREAADEVGMSSSSLYRLMKEYGIDRKSA
jgi:DNA-binding NtrC family response regulator